MPGLRTWCASELTKRVRTPISTARCGPRRAMRAFATQESPEQVQLGDSVRRLAAVAAEVYRHVDQVLAWPHLDEESLAVRQHGSFGIQNFGFGPVFTALVVSNAAFEPQRLAGGHWPQIVHFHVPCHGRETAGADGFAHGLVDQGRDDPAMQIARMAFEVVRDFGKADDGTVFGEQKVEAQAGGIGVAATEASVLCGVRQWGQVLNGFCHSYLELS